MCIDRSKFVIVLLLMLILPTLAQAHAIIRSGVDYSKGNPYAPDGNVYVAVGYVPNLEPALTSFYITVDFPSLSLESFVVGNLALNGIGDADPVITFNSQHNVTFQRSTTGDISQQFGSPANPNHFVSLLYLGFSGAGSYSINASLFNFPERGSAPIPYTTDIGPIQPMPNNGSPEPATIFLMIGALCALFLRGNREG